MEPQTVLVIGAGGVGAQVCREIAARGHHVVALDGDTLTRENQERHLVADPRYIGHLKVEALVDVLAAEFPSRDFVGVPYYIEDLRSSTLALLLAEVSVTVLATGNPQANAIVNELAGKPVLACGLWVGDDIVLGVVFVASRKKACLACAERTDGEGLGHVAFTAPEARRLASYVAGVADETSRHRLWGRRHYHFLLRDGRVAKIRVPTSAGCPHHSRWRRLLSWRPTLREFDRRAARAAIYLGAWFTSPYFIDFLGWAPGVGLWTLIFWLLVRATRRQA